MPDKKGVENMSGYIGFETASQTDEPAWFHNVESALNFANACGWEIKSKDGFRKFSEDDLDIAANVNESDVLDEENKIWTEKGLVEK